MFLPFKNITSLNKKIHAEQEFVNDKSSFVQIEYLVLLLMLCSLVVLIGICMCPAYPSLYSLSLHHRVTLRGSPLVPIK